PEYKREVRTGLATFGIRYDTLFPDLDGLSREFNYGFITRFLVRSRGIPSDSAQPPSENEKSKKYFFHISGGRIFSTPLGDGVLFFEARFQFLEINGHTRVRVSGRGAKILHGP